MCNRPEVEHRASNKRTHLKHTGTPLHQSESPTIRINDRNLTNSHIEKNNFTVYIRHFTTISLQEI
jgi:hypothetical protein